MKEQIKIMMESAQYRLHMAEYNYGDNEDYSAYDKIVHFGIREILQVVSQ